MTREKGATRVDKSAHYLFNTWKMQVYEGQYATLYHEERLYSVYDKISEQVTLVYADNPKEAIEKVICSIKKLTEYIFEQTYEAVEEGKE